MRKRTRIVPWFFRPYRRTTHRLSVKSVECNTRKELRRNLPTAVELCQQMANSLFPAAASVLHIKVESNVRCCWLSFRHGTATATFLLHVTLAKDGNLACYRSNTRVLVVASFPTVLHRLITTSCPSVYNSLMQLGSNVRSGCRNKPGTRKGRR